MRFSSYVTTLLILLACLAPAAGAAEPVPLSQMILQESDPPVGIAALNVTPVGIADTPGSAFNVVVRDGLAYVADFSAGLQIIDVTDPAAPVLVGDLAIPDLTYDVDVVGDYAYLAAWSVGMVIVDVSDPAKPVKVASVPIGGNAFAVTVEGSLAYVIDEINGMLIYDIDDPLEVTRVGIFPEASFEDVVISGRYAFVADFYSGLHVIDVGNPDWPVQVGAVPETGGAAGVDIDGDTVCVTGFNNARLYVVDVSDPAAPMLQGSSPTRNPCINVAIAGGFAYVADWFAGMTVIDISDPEAPALVGFSDPSDFAWGVDVADDLVYVASGHTGVEIFHNDLLQPELQLTLTPAAAPVTVPAEGGSFQYAVTLENHTDIVKVATVRFEAVLPDGGVRILLTVPDLILGPGQVITRSGRSQTVPGTAPPGTYVFRCLAGNVFEGVIDQDEFPVVKLDGFGGDKAGPAGWTADGWLAENGEPGARAGGGFELRAEPNPFNPVTSISFKLEAGGRVDLAVYDLGGRLVRRLVSGAVLEAGPHAIRWDGRDRAGAPAPTGTYLFRLQTAAGSQTGKMLLAK